MGDRFFQYPLYTVKYIKFYPNIFGITEKESKVGIPTKVFSAFG